MRLQDGAPRAFLRHFGAGPPGRRHGEEQAMRKCQPCLYFAACSFRTQGRRCCSSAPLLRASGRSCCFSAVATASAGLAGRRLGQVSEVLSALEEPRRQQVVSLASWPWQQVLRLVSLANSRELAKSCSHELSPALATCTLVLLS